MSTLLPGQIENLEFTPEHIETLSSPACSEVFSTIPTDEPIAIREVATELGKAPATVGHHIHQLQEVGLIIPCGTRKRRSRTETLYIKKALQNQIILRKQDWETKELYIKRFDAHLRLAARQNALAQKAMHLQNHFQDFYIYRTSSVYLNQESAQIIQDAVHNLETLIEELHEPDLQKREETPHHRVTLTTLLLPSQAESKAIIKSKKTNYKG